MIALLPFLFGTILGSFINALAFRYNSGKGMDGRSACTSCGKTLGAAELIPVLSYVFLGGRCAGCKSRISMQYPLVEIIAGCFVALSAELIADPIVLSGVVAFFAVLLFLSVYDIRHTVLPDAFVYAAAALALTLVVFLHGYEALPSHILAGVALALPLFCIWLISRGRAMGLGDAKLMFACGAFLGFSQGAAAFLLAFWIGAAYALILLLIGAALGGRRRVTMKSEVPFGPFIALATGLAYFSHASISTLIFLF